MEMSSSTYIPGFFVQPIYTDNAFFLERAR